MLKAEGTFIPLWNVLNVTATYFVNATAVNSPQRGNSFAKAATGQTALGSQPSNDVAPVNEATITGPLTLVHQGTANVVAGGDNSIPWGGSIEQDMNGDTPVTVVYGADGQPRYWANDQKAARVPVPAGGYVPATHIFNVPSNSSVIDDGGKTTTAYLNNVKILMVQSNSQTYSNPVTNVKSLSKGSSSTSFSGWVEDAKNENANTQLDSFTAYWTVPAAPSYAITQFIFNALQGPRINTGATVILQPVLEWSQGGYASQYTIVSVAGPYSGSNYFYGSRSVVQAGDVIKGTLTWNSASQSWIIITSDETPTHIATSSLSTNIIPKNTGLDVYGAVYEADGITSDKDTMMKNSNFYGLSYTLNGQSTSVSLQKWVSPLLPSDISSHLNVIIGSNNIQLITQN